MKKAALPICLLAILCACFLKNLTEKNEPVSHLPTLVEPTQKNTGSQPLAMAPSLSKQIPARLKAPAVHHSPSDVFAESEEDEANEAPRELSIKESLEDFYKRAQDPALGFPPTERLIDAVAKTKRKQAEYLAAGAYSRGDIAQARFRERGPYNIGGRTRAILIDKNDPSRKTIWSGSVSGGLFRCNDITAERPVWTVANDYLENLAINSIAQDPLNPQNIYVGTGEGFPNWDAARGLGIFKSADGGATWQLLPATRNSNFYYTRGMAVAANGYVYAATDSGLYQSKDGGNTWQKVLGSGIVPTSDTFYDVFYIATNNTLYASNSGSVWKSGTGNAGDWTSLSTNNTNFPSSISQFQLAVCYEQPDYMYVVGDAGGEGSRVYKSTDGGAHWQARTRPGDQDYTNGQVWYDLDLAVAPNNPNSLYLGGVPMFKSNDGGSSWNMVANNMHVDQHIIVFDEEQPNVIYFGNDGGIWRSENAGAGQPTVLDRNNSYNVTQFYACAIHPDTFSNYFLAGAQDNNSLQLNNADVAPARAVLGGDGFLCHIDQNEPNIQMVSLQFGAYSLSKDGGANFSGGANFEGDFLNPSDYDDNANIMYAETNNGDYYRWFVNTGITEIVDVNNVNLDVSTIAVDPNTSNRVYFGTYNSRIYRVDNANTGDAVDAVNLPSLGGGAISSIVIQDGDPNHLLVTVSNYGLENNIFESKNGGFTWIGVEGANVPDNLPDMPVWWGIFNPNNPEQAMIATEAGVWTTEKLQGDNTVWIPPVPGKGCPLIRVRMLQDRKSDKFVLAATYGRGLWTCDVFADPKARMLFDQVHYLNSPKRFLGNISIGADSYFWQFGDGGTDTLENPYHSYTGIGQYNVDLTVNGSLHTNAPMKILPDKTLPYNKDGNNYSGDFEGFEEDYGVYTISGSGFERGKSTMNYKDGTHSGENAFVIGLNEQYYKPNSNSMLFLPNFDFSAAGIYELSFWGKWKLDPGKDGMLVEYSTDRGQNWKILGSDTDEEWYNFRNVGQDYFAFPDNTPYFTKTYTEFRQFKLNVSNLAGQQNVAIRFVFKSEGTGNFPGLVIDDVEINRYDGDLRTTLRQFTGAFKVHNGSDIILNWTTLPEYYCTHFELERSENGQTFDPVNQGTVPATGYLTAYPQNYEFNDFGTKRLYYYRLKVVNDVPLTGIDTFYSPIVVVRQDTGKAKVYSLFPNPVQDHINVVFTDQVTDDVLMELFDAAGKLVISRKTHLNSEVIARLDTGQLPEAYYVIRITIGKGTPESFKVLIL